MPHVRVHVCLPFLLALGLLPGLAAAQAPARRGVQVLPVPQDVRVQEGFDASQSAGLFVGIRHFDDADFVEIPYAVDDAVDLAYLFAVELRLIAPRKVVLSLAGAPQKSISQDRLKALREAGASVRPATFSEILRLLEKQRQESRPQGLFVVTFATHGFSNEGNDFLLASDSLRHRLTSTGLAAGKIFDAVAQAQAPRRLLLLDACRERLSPSRALTDEHGAMSPSLAEAIAQARGQVVLSGATRGGYSYDDPDRGNGVFTGAVLDGLRGQAPADGRSFITVRLLADFVDRQVAQWIRHNRREHAEVSRGISLTLDAVAVAEMPLAILSPRQARPEVPSSAAASPSDEMDFTGEWRGIYHLYPHPLGMTLSIWRSYENNEQRFEGRLQLHPLETPRRGRTSQPPGTYEVSVGYDPGSQSLMVKLGPWLGPSPRQARLADMIAVYSRSDDTIAGIFEKWPTDSSPFFTLKRPGSAASLIEAAIKTWHVKRSSWPIGIGGPSKEQVDAWADRFVQEYPGRRPNSIPMWALYTDARKLFKDSHFVRYFLKPYDELGRMERMAVQKKLRKPDPQEGDYARNSFAEYGFEPSTGTFRIVDITISVLAMRSIDHWYEEMRYRLENLEPSSSAAQTINSIEAQVKRLPQALWPSEIAAIESRARQFRSEIPRAGRPE